MWWNRSQPCKRKGAVATIATIVDSLESRVLLSASSGYDQSKVSLQVQYHDIPLHITPGQEVNVATITMIRHRGGKTQFRGLQLTGPQGAEVELRFGNTVIASGHIGAGDHIGFDARGETVPVASKKNPNAEIEVYVIAPLSGVSDGPIQAISATLRYGSKSRTFEGPITGPNRGVNLDFTSNDPPVVIPPVDPPVVIPPVDPPVIDPPVITPVNVIVNVTTPITVTPIVTTPVTVTPIVTTPVTVTPVVTTPVTVTPVVTTPVVTTPVVVVPPIVVPPVIGAYVPFTLRIHTTCDQIRVTDFSVQFVPTSVMVGTTVEVYANPLGGNFTGGSLGSGVVQSNGLLEIHLTSPFNVFSGGDWELQFLYYGVALQDVDTALSMGYIRNGIQHTAAITGSAPGPYYVEVNP